MTFVRVALAVFAVAALTACSVGPKAACTEIGGTSSFGFAVDPEIQGKAVTYRVALCQDAKCGYVVFPADPGSGDGLVIQPGVRRSGASYNVDLEAFDADFDADATTAMTLEVRTAGDITTYLREEQFEFEKTYPNGERCDKEPFLSHRTALRLSDRVQG